MRQLLASKNSNIYSPFYSQNYSREPDYLTPSTTRIAFIKKIVTKTIVKNLKPVTEASNQSLLPYSLRNFLN